MSITRISVIVGDVHGTFISALKSLVCVITTLFFMVACLLCVTEKAFAESASTATGLSSAFNPSIGANILFIGAYSDRSNSNSDAFQNGMHIQEAEFSLMAVVDPFFRVQLTLSIPGTEGIEAEEAYVQTTSLPRGLSMQVGRFHLPFGKQNRLHTHAYSFIDAPWINTLLLGEDSLDEVGVEVSYLAPLSWFSEAAVMVYDPSGVSPFIQRQPHEMGYLANWRNLWNLNDNTTIELGFSGTTAKTSMEEMMRLSLPIGDQDQLPDNEIIRAGDLYLVGSDVTLKHVSTRYRSWDASVEYIQGIGVFDKSAQAQFGGITGYGRFQLRRRWWVQGRGDLLGLPLKVPQASLADVPGETSLLETLKEGDHPWRVSGGVALVLSEFTVVRLQYDYADRIIGPPENRVMLQMNITFGAHPAHSY